MPKGKRDPNKYPLKGTCLLCESELEQKEMLPHLTKNCLKSPEKAVAKNDYYILEIKALCYWLYVQISKDSTLLQLDSLLREKWLECCGHMSQFEIFGPEKKKRDWEMFSEGNETYVFLPFEKGDKAMKDATVGKVLSVGSSMGHVYDFGTSTECFITVVEEGHSDSHLAEPRVLARNLPPIIPCSGKKTCKEPAKVYCVEDGNPYCKGCAKKVGDDNRLPVVNSPRSGECGYTGEEGEGEPDDEPDEDDEDSDY